MNAEAIAYRQAVTLLALALDHDEDHYVLQMQNIGDPLQVVNQLVKLLFMTIEPDDHERFAQGLFEALALPDRY